MTNPHGEAQALFNDLLRELEARFAQRLLAYHPDLAKSTGIVPGGNLPTGGNTGGGYTPAPHNHTTGDITGLAEFVEDTIGTKIVAGSNVTVSYDDASGQTTISSTGGGSGGGSVLMYAASLGDGTTTNYNIVHGIGTRDVIVEVYQTASPYGRVYPDILHTNSASINLVFASAPTSNQYRVVVFGVPDPA